MDESQLLVRCFLCRQKNSSNRHKPINSTYCPSSKKAVEEVLQHLARQSKTVLHIRREWICVDCYNRIIEFDTALVRTLRKQRNLAKLVEQSVLNFDTDSELEEEYMLELDKLNDAGSFDDLEISDSEISQTIEDAIGKNEDIDHFEWKEKLQKNVFRCGLCAMEFRNRARLHRHISRAHKKFSCELCPFSHSNEDYVMLHMNLHEGRKENQCRFCEKRFTTKLSTIRHMEVHFDSKKYQCDKCGLCFSQTTVLYNHKLQHEAEEQPLQCEICNQIFKTKRTYRHHMITHQADRPRYSCEYCAKTFTEKYTLKVHKRTHAKTNQLPDTHPINQEQQDITATGTTCTSPQSASAKAEISSMEARFNCIICDQHFGIKEHLNKHMERAHDVILKSLTLTNFTQYEVVTNEPRRPCHVCGHMFKTQANLDHHLEHMHDIEFK